MKRALACLAMLFTSCFVLAQAQSPGSTPGDPGTKTLEEIFACLATGLPKDWRTATVEVVEVANDGKAREFEARYTYTRASEPQPRRLKPCDETLPAKGVHAFNQFLEPEKRRWIRALLTCHSDGKFELKYDYDQ
ncbi:MAG: hypothetical protein HY017_24600 [Betaproteobacteria bacterium]|nr:hypothetical protein [Betaproteobacteria bacterium]